MGAEAASAAAWLDGTERALRPPPRLTLSEWADQFFYLSPESSAESGRWTTLAYQRGIMDAITDDAVEQVTLMKSARVGATKIMCAAIGFFMHQDPCPIMVVQPTVEDAQGFSKEEIAPMLRDCEVLAALVKEPTAKISEQTILHKGFTGGSLSMVGANSGRGFRRVSRRVVFFDELDGYPATAGAEGDQVKLGIRRTEYYHNRKIGAWSTPLTAGASRIEELFLAGDRRRYYVPCPQCGHMDYLVFNEGQNGRGHWMRWDQGKPESAHFVCRKNGCVIEHQEKRGMIDRGEWRAEGEFSGHASFHIWAAYSLSPNATWGQLAAEFLEAKTLGPDKLKTFVNTVLGETWQEVGDAPDWEKLYLRREAYPIGSVPAGVRFLTCGVDVQKDRLMYEVVGWSETKESWSIEAAPLYGDTSLTTTWAQLDDLLARSFPGADGRDFSIGMMAVDSGYNTQQVYGWTRRYPRTRVIACKGVAEARDLIGAASVVDVTLGGKRMARGQTMRPVGVSIAKTELYGFLGLPRPAEGEPAPAGYCHFPEYDEGYFKQLTAEHLLRIRTRKGFTRLEWHVQVGRENHFLDARVYARAAAAALGIDRMKPKRATPARPRASAPAVDERAPEAAPAPAPPVVDRARRPRGGMFKPPRNGGSWFKPPRRR